MPMPRAAPLPPLTTTQQQLVESCRRFAYQQAWRWAAKLGRGPARAGGSAPVDQQLVDELASAALHGLCIAAARFEPERGHEFTTYAGWWVMQCIRRHIEQLHPVSASHARAGVPWTVCRVGHAKDDGKPFDIEARDEAPVAHAIDPDLMTIVRQIPDERSRAMLLLHLVDGETLLEVGNRFGVTRERVRQIVERAILRLRASKQVRAIWHRRQAESLAG